MPFLGKDFRAPGHNWIKIDSKWCIKHPVYSVAVENIERSKTKQFLEEFFHYRMKKKKKKIKSLHQCGNPDFKCKTHDRKMWLQVGDKGSKEINGYMTIGEMIRKLDLVSSAKIDHRFSYVLEIVDLIVEYKINNLSGLAQTNLLCLIETLVEKAVKIRREYNKLRSILCKLEEFLSHKLREHKNDPQQKILFFITQVQIWQQKLKSLSAVQNTFHSISLTNLPFEMQRQIVSCLNDHNDVRNLSSVSPVLRLISEEITTWKNLCQINYSKAQLNSAKLMLKWRLSRKIKENRKFGTPLPSDYRCNYDNLTEAEEWKNIYHWLNRSYWKRDFNYIDPLYYCCRCKVIYWKEPGHPCVENNAVKTIKLSPRKLVFFFDGNKSHFDDQRS